MNRYQQMFKDGRETVQRAIEERYIHLYPIIDDIEAYFEPEKLEQTKHDVKEMLRKAQEAASAEVKKHLDAGREVYGRRNGKPVTITPEDQWDEYGLIEQLLDSHGVPRETDRGTPWGLAQRVERGLEITGASSYRSGLAKALILDKQDDISKCPLQHTTCSEHQRHVLKQRNAGCVQCVVEMQWGVTGYEINKQSPSTKG